MNDGHAPTAAHPGFVRLERDRWEPKATQSIRRMRRKPDRYRGFWGKCNQKGVWGVGAPPGTSVQPGRGHFSRTALLRYAHEVATTASANNSEIMIGGTVTEKAYRAPPIFEAIIEIRFQEPRSLKALEKAARRIKSRYETAQNDQEVEVQVRLEAAGVITPQISKPTPIRRFASNDQADRCTINPKRFHWSRFAPYEGWDIFRDRVVEDLGAMLKGERLPALTRIGVRFRNRLDVKDEGNGICRYEDHLSINLSLPPLLDPLDMYQWRVEKTMRPSNLRLVLMSGIVPPELPATNAFLLDIDVSEETDLPINFEQLVEKLEQMRNLKNDVFEASITPLARKSFE